ncbi:flavodoxin, partial [Lactobacillus nasalidis]|uniref:flavodoxin n=1 Tax=Lactobacillus nasalidis TaxID=2797258 RepID=UPI001916465D
MKKLIAYYSWSGTTKKAAQKLAAKEKADLLEITVPGHVYELGMRQVADLAIDQLKSKSYPVIAHDQIPVASYDQIIVAAPVWSGEPAVPAYSFLKELAERGYQGEVAAFETDAGSVG